MDAFRSVARLVRRGLVGADGAPAPDITLTVAQMRDYVRALHAWNPEVVETSDYAGRTRAELAAFLERYATAPELNNPARTADASDTLEGIVAHLRGRPPSAGRPTLDDIKREVAEAQVQAFAEAQAQALAQAHAEAHAEAQAKEQRERRLAAQEEMRGRRHHAFDAHRDVREKRDAIRAYVHSLLLLDLRRKRVEAQLQSAAERVAALTTEVLSDTDASTDSSGPQLAECQAALEALACELDAVLADAAALPGGAGPDADFKAIIARLVNEESYLEEERALLAERVSQVDAEIVTATLCEKDRK